jgi:hypothetical protein
MIAIIARTTYQIEKDIFLSTGIVITYPPLDAQGLARITHERSAVIAWWEATPVNITIIPIERRTTHIQYAPASEGESTYQLVTLARWNCKEET